QLLLPVDHSIGERGSRLAGRNTREANCSQFKPLRRLTMRERLERAVHIHAGCRFITEYPSIFATGSIFNEPNSSNWRVSFTTKVRTQRSDNAFSTATSGSETRSSIQSASRILDALEVPSTT